MNNLKEGAKAVKEINYLTASLLYGLALLVYIAAIIFSYFYRKRNKEEEVENEDVYRTIEN